jgi:uncharacterized membrane protein YeaQ/YmgE (transglycosylase-associated protein family)
VRGERLAWLVTVPIAAFGCESAHALANVWSAMFLLPHQLTSLLIAGALVGVTARLLHPGRERLGVAATILLGLVSTLFAGGLLRGMFLVVFGIVLLLAVMIAYGMVWLWARVAPAEQG